jgi:hypothetical protein
MGNLVMFTRLILPWLSAEKDVGGDADVRERVRIHPLSPPTDCTRLYNEGEIRKGTES